MPGALRIQEAFMEKVLQELKNYSRWLQLDQVNLAIEQIWQLRQKLKTL